MFVVVFVNPSVPQFNKMTSKLKSISWKVTKSINVNLNLYYKVVTSS